MSRSRHQRHSTGDILGLSEHAVHCKRHGIRCDARREFIWRRRKIRPYGLKLLAGYGEEAYSSKYRMEYRQPLVDNKSRRMKDKSELRRVLQKCA